MWYCQEAINSNQEPCIYSETTTEEFGHILVGCSLSNDFRVINIFDHLYLFEEYSLIDVAMSRLEEYLGHTA